MIKNIFLIKIIIKIKNIFDHDQNHIFNRQIFLYHDQKNSVDHEQIFLIVIKNIFLNLNNYLHQKYF